MPVTLWVNRSGKGGEYAALFLDQNLIGISYGFREDLSTFDSYESLRDRLFDYHSQLRHPPKAMATRLAAGALWRFVKELTRGDWVIVPLVRRPVLCVAEVTGDYAFSGVDSPDPLPHTRAVRWVAQDIPRTAVDSELLASLNGWQALYTPQLTDAAARVRALVNQKPPVAVDPLPAARTSHDVQAKLARLGVKLGLDVWVAKADREHVRPLLAGEDTQFLDRERLPLNYDAKTIHTVENIDVLWLQGNSIVRAFEVEHTTAVYSGLLRMLDLRTLQPNMTIKSHIVAPAERRDKVFKELARPAFGLLAKSCTYLCYDQLDIVGALPGLGQYVTEAVVDAYAETPDRST